MMCRVGQNHIYIWCVYGIFGRKNTKYTVIYGVYIRFWPTLMMCDANRGGSYGLWPFFSSYRHQLLWNMAYLKGRPEP